MAISTNHMTKIQVRRFQNTGPCLYTTAIILQRFDFAYTRRLTSFTSLTSFRNVNSFKFSPT